MTFHMSAYVQKELGKYYD
jgi:dynein heavy chain, axonemal